MNWEKRLQFMETEFGTDVIPYLYQPDFHTAHLPRLARICLNTNDEHPLSQTIEFERCSPVNFPGPFYTSLTDNCGTGQPEAPQNVLYDGNLREFIFRQPTSMRELCALFHAAYIEPFGNYAFDGNQQWTLERIRSWWKAKPRLTWFLNQAQVSAANDGQNLVYLDYLNHSAESDLRKYAYFLETGTYPRDDDSVRLPDIG